MIELDIDLSYLAKHFNIGSTQIQKYSKTKSVKEIVEAEAENGNTEAANFEKEVLKDPKEIVKLFKLSDTTNKYKILKNMNESDLEYMMQFLSKEDLSYALNFFTKTKLLDMLTEAPKEEILKVAFDAFSVEDFLKLIPEKEMDKFFKSEKVDKKQIKENLKTFPPEALAKMIESVTGTKPDGKSQPEMFQEIEEFNDEQLLDGMESLNKKYKMRMIQKLTQKDEDLWKEFSSDTLVKPLEQLEKGELMLYMEDLEEDSLLKMVDELPQDYLAIVATQIDPQVMAENLIKYFSDILSEICAAS